MTPKFQPGDLIKSNSGYIHIIWAVDDDFYYYEIYEKGKFKTHYQYEIDLYEWGTKYKLTKLELALM